VSAEAILIFRFGTSAFWRAKIRVGRSVRVHIRRRAQVGVPEQFLNEFQVSSFLVDDGGRRVGERVKSGCPARAYDAKAIQRWIKHIASEHVGIER
jgi:hypothetical protein